MKMLTGLTSFRYWDLLLLAALAVLCIVGGVAVGVIEAEHRAEEKRRRESYTEGNDGQ